MNLLANKQSRFFFLLLLLLPVLKDGGEKVDLV